MARTSREIRSEVRSDGTLELSVARVDVPEPGPGEVTVRVEASPLNPSDLGLLLGWADVTTAQASSGPEGPVVTAQIPAAAMKGLQARVGQSLTVGNEGAGVVVATGDSDDARALDGKVVSMIGGSMYGEFRTIGVGQCMELPEGTTPADGASWFVNPLTALGMVETMRNEGHSALVHTAAASNLGQMLVKLCAADGVPLVNVVRREAQAKQLRELGAEHVVVSTAEDFPSALEAALRATDATLAFDAIGGGKLAGQILQAMEAAQSAKEGDYSRYGSSTHKQVYIYGSLDTGPTEFNRSFGLAWGIGGWLLTPFLQQAGIETIVRLRARVASELKTTFASHYTRVVSLDEALSLEAIAAYDAKATGEKYLIDPSKTD